MKKREQELQEREEKVNKMMLKLRTSCDALPKSCGVQLADITNTIVNNGILTQTLGTTGSKKERRTSRNVRESIEDIHLLDGGKSLTSSIDRPKPFYTISNDTPTNGKGD